MSEGSTLDAAKRLIAEQDAAETRPSMRLYAELPWTPDNMLKIARAMLEDPGVGDVPESVVHGFAMELRAADSDRVLGEIERLRRAHFKRLGKPVPEYPGKFVR